MRTKLQSAALAILFGLASTMAAAQTAPPTKGAETANGLKLGEQQISKIKKYFAGTSDDDRPVAVASLAVSVGARAPDGIAAAPLPGAILVELPPGADYAYFLRGEDLVIINADSRVVVAVVPTGS